MRHAHVAASWSGRQHSTMVAHSFPSPLRVSWCRNSRYSVAHGTEVARYSTAHGSDGEGQHSTRYGLIGILLYSEIKRG